MRRRKLGLMLAAFPTAAPPAYLSRLVAHLFATKAIREARGRLPQPRGDLGIGPDDRRCSRGTLDSGAKCNRAMQTGFARLCQAL